MIALGLALVFVSLAPKDPLYRVWWSIGYSLLLPLAVIGRTQRRMDSGWLTEAFLQVGRRRLIALDWVVVCAHAFIAALAVSMGHWVAFLTCFTWALLVMVIADLADRYLVSPGQAWVWTLLIVCMIVVAPVLMAPTYGNTPFAPNVVTYTVGIHPGAMYLTAHGLPALQNPIFYTVSLVGVIEAYPVRWQFGVGTYFALAVVSIAWSFVMPVRRKAILR